MCQGERGKNIISVREPKTLAPDRTDENFRKALFALITSIAYTLCVHIKFQKRRKICVQMCSHHP